ncbi:MAG: Hydroxymethylpyrimidine/phosphomethylpyrimidine kinase [Legionellaceae bacterium]
MEFNSYITTLTIAGSDPSGGAGIQADLKTFSALGCYGMSVITALTAQNTQGVTAIQAIPTSFVIQQWQTLINDITIHAMKIGMLHNAELILALATQLADTQIPLIIDPVMTAKDGSILLEMSAISAFKQALLPISTLLTPNIPEAEILLNQTITHKIEMEEAAKSLAKMGPNAVLLKGGHLLTDELSDDCLYIKTLDTFFWFSRPRIHTKNTHGTGCTLSAAITAYLAKGYELIDAIKKAKEYLYEALLAGSHYQLGQGHGPVHHFYEIWSHEHKHT